MPIVAVSYCLEREESAFIKFFQFCLCFLSLSSQKLFNALNLAEKLGTTEPVTLWKRSKNSGFLLLSGLGHSDKSWLVMLYSMSDGACCLKQEECLKHPNSLEACSYIFLLAEGRILLLDGLTGL